MPSPSSRRRDLLDDVPLADLIDAAIDAAHAGDVPGAAGLVLAVRARDPWLAVALAGLLRVTFTTTDRSTSHHHEGDTHG